MEHLGRRSATVADLSLSFKPKSDLLLRCMTADQAHLPRRWTERRLSGRGEARLSGRHRVRPVPRVWWGSFAVAACAVALASPAVAAAASHASTTRPTKVRTVRVVAQHGALVRVRPNVQLWIPRHTLLRNADVSVYSVDRTWLFRIGSSWRGHLYLRVGNSHGHAVTVRRLAGIYVESSQRRPHASASSLLEHAGDGCIDIAQDAPEFYADPFFTFACLSALASQEKQPTTAPAVTYQTAEDLAAQISPTCLAHIQNTFKNLGAVPIFVFKDDYCKKATEPTGPSDGTPLVVAVLTYPTIKGIPLGPPTTTRTPVPTPKPAPTPVPVSSGDYYVQNADGGIFWRSGADWNTAIATPGVGLYPGTVIRPSCYASGAANVPGSGDSMWEQASWVSGPGGGSGWVNEHFIADGQPINQASPGVPACSAPPPPPQTWSEQETPNHPVNTFTDYHNASGMGPAIASGEWVQVSCKVYDPTIASVNPDGYWYRIASSPWNNAYYSPANTFMNGDPYGGPYTHNTDFNVPDC
jgi:hypothetical protein